MRVEIESGVRMFVDIGNFRLCLPLYNATDVSRKLVPSSFDAKILHHWSRKPLRLLEPCRVWLARAVRCSCSAAKKVQSRRSRISVTAQRPCPPSWSCSMPLQARAMACAVKALRSCWR